MKLGDVSLKITSFIGIGLLSCFTVQESSLAQNKRSFTIYNNTGLSITHLYMSGSSNTSWGDNDLSAQLYSGNSYSYSLQGSCNWDIRAKLIDGSELTQQNVNTCVNSSYTFGNQLSQSRDQYRDSGGSPEAIASCMKKLMYERKLVCTRDSINACSAYPQDGWAGWQAQDVRTDISESAAVQACKNAR
jgi:hypothetical protein